MRSQLVSQAKIKKLLELNEKIGNFPTLGFAILSNMVSRPSMENVPLLQDLVHLLVELGLNLPGIWLGLPPHKSCSSQQSGPGSRS